MGVQDDTPLSQTGILHNPQVLKMHRGQSSDQASEGAALEGERIVQEENGRACAFCGGLNRGHANYCRRCGASLLPEQAGAEREGAVAYSQNETGHLALESTRAVGDEPHVLEPGAMVDGRYRVEKKIGEGGMGRVFLAQDRSGRRYVLKQIRERRSDDDPAAYQAYVRSFQREASILSSLPHPFLPIARDFIAGEDDLLIVLDYIEGRTLADELEASPGLLPEERVLNWGVQVCEALAYLHGKQPPIIHRNIKPKNILLTPTAPERVRLIGFSLARYYVEGLERDEDILGTRGYSPPEQYGLAQTDARSDVFGLGATLFALLTRREPGEYARAGESGEPRFNFPPLGSLNPAISEDCAQLVAQALQEDPARRFASANNMKAALEAILRRSQAGPPSQLLEKYRLNQPVTMEENRYCEFKEVKGENPLIAIKRLVDEYVVAFLNSEGGRIFWGIRDEDRVVVGVPLSYKERDAVRKLITDKIIQIQPAVAPSSYHVTLHPVYEGGQPRSDRVVVEVHVQRPPANLLYFTATGEVYVKTDSGRKRLSGAEIHAEILRRLR